MSTMFVTYLGGVVVGLLFFVLVAVLDR